MSNLSFANKTTLEKLFHMDTGYVLGFTNAAFANIFAEIGIDIYEDKYMDLGNSKANRMRAFWKIATDSEVSAILNLFADYLESAPRETDFGKTVPALDIDNSEQAVRIRSIAEQLDATATSGSESSHLVSSSVSTTAASVTENTIRIEIHEDIYNHIKLYLENNDYFHAVEESYKIVREALRDITGQEQAHKAFSAANNEKIFGHAPVTQAESDFFEGVKYLNMSIQYLRNEKAHTPATPLEKNHAIHYISLASLAYDLVTKHVSEKIIQSVTDAIVQKRRSYKTASDFYEDFENGNWMDDLQLPVKMTSTVSAALKDDILKNVDLTISYDSSNIAFMQLMLVSTKLTAEDLDLILDLPTSIAGGNDQAPGKIMFFRYIQDKCPQLLSTRAKEWIVSGNK